MRTFLTIWSGQTASLIGSKMSRFSLTIWMWEITEQTTALALFAFFTQIPRILIAPFAGIIVDRYNRKLLMIAGDTVAGISTIAILFLYLTHNLQIWHLYVVGSITGTFEQIQELAYSATISMMVPQKQYSRASSIGFLANYSSNIMAPALAGSLYYLISLAGILTIDLITFVLAVTTVLFVQIPQPKITETAQQSRPNILHEISFGFRYIAKRPSLLALLLSASLFWFAHDIGAALYSPMILARTGNDARVLGTVASAAGIGGVLGALIITGWGGPKRRINGFLLGMVGAGASKIVFGFGQMLFIWIPAQFCSSLNFPLLGSSYDGIWLAKVKPAVQGRVFATRSMLMMIMSALGYLIAGPLADYVFEPAMKPEGSLVPIFGGIFGTGNGAGVALLYVISSICLLLVGLSGYACRRLRDVERLVPDRDENF
ncbi:MFS transporter [Microcoleus sp. FACHB-672]|uniref:MFS transporter n=1 Tax=Microcoleus sp. FACHB-672 TaxID=2692825 RepID=UPI001683323C|nr:MFS transporter [Microcoleus sp. FACHB-672]MBD2040613.1 MFS transporter [Microcoleus sp. FACHB-672]